MCFVSACDAFATPPLRSAECGKANKTALKTRAFTAWSIPLRVGSWTGRSVVRALASSSLMSFFHRSGCTAEIPLLKKN
jgi:hypothetical protein